MFLIQQLISFIIVFPVLVFIFVWLIAKSVGVRKRRRVGIASDVTTPVMFFAVALLADWLSIPHAMTNLLLFLLFIAIIFVIVLWKNKNDVSFRVIFRVLWRIYFITLCVLYLVGWLIGLYQSVSKYVSG